MLDFLQAVATNNIPEVREFLGKGIDINVTMPEGNAENYPAITALHIATQEGNLSMMELLIGHGADVNKAPINGMTPLHQAVDTTKNNALQLTELLLKAGANPNVSTHQDGYTPLHVSVLWDSREDSTPDRQHNIAKALLVAGANAFAVTHNNESVWDFIKKYQATGVMSAFINAKQLSFKWAYRGRQAAPENYANLELILDNQKPFDTQIRYGHEPMQGYVDILDVYKELKRIPPKRGGHFDIHVNGTRYKGYEGNQSDTEKGTILVLFRETVELWIANDLQNLMELLAMPQFYEARELHINGPAYGAGILANTQITKIEFIHSSGLMEAFDKLS